MLKSKEKIDFQDHYENTLVDLTNACIANFEALKIFCEDFRWTT